jgi:LysR family hydrogen peroxide-inducible transcriptional activator
LFGKTYLTTMRPTLRQLQYLLAIADTGRYADAALRVNVTQPTLSEQITQLELELGARLIERGRHGAILTPIGRVIAERARRVLQDMEELKSAARSGEDGLSGRVRMGALPSVGPYLLPEAIKRLHAAYPDFRLMVREERTAELAAGLAEGTFDVVIATASDLSAAQADHLFTESVWVCSAPGDPLAVSREPVTLADLAGRELLSLGRGHKVTAIAQVIAAEADCRLSSEYEGTSLDAIRLMATTGVGLAVLPGIYTMREARRDPDLMVRRIDHPLARRELSLLFRASSPLADSFAVIASALRETAAGFPPEAFIRD